MAAAICRRSRRRRRCGPPSSGPCRTGDNAAIPVTVANSAAVAAGLVAAVLASVRWLRVAQREHYRAGSATRFALRWWLGVGPNRVLTAAALMGVVLSPVSPVAALAGAAAIAVGPFGMSVLGRVPGRLVWTRRVRTLAA